MSFKIGDRVIVVGQRPWVWPQRGKIGTVVDPHATDRLTGERVVETDLPAMNPLNKDRGALFEAKDLRKIDDDDDTASWEQIEKLTKWNPTREVA